MISLLISYDIEDNYLRQKMANHILDTGLDRVQYSVYIGTLKEGIITKLVDWANALPQQKQWKGNDSILILSLTPTQLQQMRIVGNPKWDKDELSGEQHTLIL